MTQELADLMLSATTDLRNPDEPEQVIQRFQRRRHRRAVAISAAAAVVVAAAAITVPLSGVIGGSSNNTSSVKPAPIAASSAPDYLAGPKPPANADHLLGRAYVIDQLTADGQPRDVVVYWTDQILQVKYPNGYAQAVQPGPSLCAALWEPGTPLSSAYPMQCTGLGTPAPPASTELFYWWEGTNTNPDVYHPRDGTFSAAFPNVDLLLVNKDAARVQLLIARESDLAATASPDGGHPPVRKTMTVNVIGNGQSAAVSAFAIAPKLPTGWVYVGETIYDSQGKVLLHQVSGNYCGPDGKGNDPPCPTTPSTG
jgi:hypothetical protein